MSYLKSRAFQENPVELNKSNRSNQVIDPHRMELLQTGYFFFFVEDKLGQFFA